MTKHSHPLTDEQARSLTLPTEPWLSCEECFDLSDQLAELLLADPTTSLMEPMFVHLRACPACAEEAESLVVLVAEEHGVDPSPAVQRLNA